MRKGQWMMASLSQDFPLTHLDLTIDWFDGLSLKIGRKRL
jgi:hypothetical protein